MRREKRNRNSGSYCSDTGGQFCQRSFFQGRVAVEELYSGEIKILGEDEEVGGDMLELSEDEDSEVMKMENADEAEEAAEKAEGMMADESEEETEA